MWAVKWGGMGCGRGICEAWRVSTLYPCPWKDSRPSVISQTPSSSCCPAHNHSLTPCPVGTTHLYEFRWNNTFMNRSVSCFCGLFYPPNQSTPRINHFKNSSQLSMRCPPHPSVQFSHSVVSDSLWPHGLQQARIPFPSPTPGDIVQWVQ